MGEIRKVFLVFYIPTAVFIALDLIMTYVGVCHLHGIELNVLTVHLIGRYGYVLISVFQFAIYAGACLLLAFFYSKSKLQIMKIFFVVFWSMIIINYGRTVLFNALNLIQATTGRPMPSHAVMPTSQAQVEYANATFEPIRDDFCRLLP
jgi:hypothetical protein